jgi:WD40 repeat protein
MHAYKQAQTSKLILKDHSGPVIGAAVSHDSKLIATACGDCIKIWHADSGKLVYTLTRKGECLFCLDFSSDGGVLASASSGSGNCIHVWGLKSGGIPTVLRTLKGHKKRILCVRVSPDCQRLASTSYDATVCIWNVESGTLLATFSRGQAVTKCVAWSRDSKRIAGAGGHNGISVYEAATGRRLKVLEEPLSQPLNNRLVHLAFLTDDTVRVCTCLGTDIIMYEVCERKYDFAQLLGGHEKNVTGMALSPDNKYFASASRDNTVRVWDTETGTVLHVFEGHSLGADIVVWSPDGDFIVSASEDWTACVWSVDEQVCVCCAND